MYIYKLKDFAEIVQNRVILRNIAPHPVIYYSHSYLSVNNKRKILITMNLQSFFLFPPMAVAIHPLVSLWPSSLYSIKSSIPLVQVSHLFLFLFQSPKPHHFNAKASFFIELFWLTVRELIHKSFLITQNPKKNPIFFPHSGKDWIFGAFEAPKI